MKTCWTGGGAFLLTVVLSGAIYGCAPGRPAVQSPTQSAGQGSLTDQSPLLASKCSRCHDLGRVYAVMGSGGEWVKTVVVMSGKEEGWISAEEMENLAACTYASAEAPSRREVPAPPEALLPPRAVLEKKCSRCHGLARIYSVIDDPLQWVRTVASMSDKDREWIPANVMKVLIIYRQRHPEYVERLFQETCGTCHRWDELRAMNKTVAQWRTEINYMARRCSEGMEDDEREAIFHALAAQ